MKQYFWGGIVGGALIAAMLFMVSRTPEPLIDESQTVVFGGVSLKLEYATTTATRERGLGGRTSLPEDAAMLFVFPKDDRYGFWMKDTLIPLDIFWLDAQGHVVFMAQNIATSSYPNVFYPTKPARYVLETNAGFGSTHAIATGTPLELKNLPSVSK